MGDINMSLDDIIKKKNFNGPKKAGFNRQQPKIIKRLGDTNKVPFVNKKGFDARQKLMRKPNARPLAGTAPVVDARFKIEAMRQNSRTRNTSALMSAGLTNRGILRRGVQRDSVFLDPLSGDMDVDMYESIPRRAPLVCTVPNTDRKRIPFDWDRPVDDEILLERFSTPVMARERMQEPDLHGITLTVRNRQPMPQPSRAPPTFIPRDVPLSGKLSLSDRFSKDQPGDSAKRIRALKAHLQAQAPPPPEPPKSETGHRIVVSNLLRSVTHEDVKELFSDIGELISSKVVRPGVAEVVYRYYEDALKAVDVYHDRHLDDQPMKCLLVKNNQTLPKVTKRNVELDLNTLRNAIHHKMSS